MEKKILLATDGSVHSKNALTYAMKMAESIRNLHYTLFNIQPHVSQFLEDEAKTSIKARLALERLKETNAEKSLEMLEELKNHMKTSGVDESRIDVKSLPRRVGFAKDILDFAQTKHYDAIVAGRRGLSRVQEVFMGSLTSKLVEHSNVIPLWIVDGKVSSPKVIVLIDGSEGSLRAVDHASFIFREHAGASITLFHVMPRMKDYVLADSFGENGEMACVLEEADRRGMDCFMSLTYQKFKEAGIRESQIAIKQVKPRLTVGDTIMDEIRSGDYGTVVIGRRGADKAFFMGSVSNYLLNRITNRAVWLVS